MFEQLFTLDEHGRLRPSHCASLCLDVKGEKLEPGAGLVFWTAKEPAAANQRFELDDHGYLGLVVDSSLIVGTSERNPSVLELQKRDSHGRQLKFVWLPTAVLPNAVKDAATQALELAKMSRKHERHAQRDQAVYDQEHNTGASDDNTHGAWM